MTRARGAKHEAQMFKEAHPPTKRLWVPWLVAALAAGIWALARLFTPGAAFAVAAVVSIGSTLMAYQAYMFNTRDFPVLYQQWQCSFMCSRCGEVFVAII